MRLRLTPRALAEASSGSSAAQVHSRLRTKYAISRQVSGLMSPVLGVR